MKNIAILTSGGDAPGMNACIRATTRYALAKGLKVFGVEKGYTGLIENKVQELNSRSVSDIICVISYHSVVLQATDMIVRVAAWHWNLGIKKKNDKIKNKGWRDVIIIVNKVI